tara:strand:- start:20 stop:133 length:114 start_codon:yes stop_codon:yes gene_type:complete
MQEKLKVAVTISKMPRKWLNCGAEKNDKNPKQFNRID